MVALQRRVVARRSRLRLLRWEVASNNPRVSRPCSILPQVMKAHEKIVTIVVNDEPVDITMRLGYSGEAYFIDEASYLEQVRQKAGSDLRPANSATHHHRESPPARSRSTARPTRSSARPRSTRLQTSLLPPRPPSHRRVARVSGGGRCACAATPQRGSCEQATEIDLDAVELDGAAGDHPAARGKGELPIALVTAPVAVAPPPLMSRSTDDSAAMRIVTPPSCVPPGVIRVPYSDPGVGAASSIAEGEGAGLTRRVGASQPPMRSGGSQMAG